MKHSRLVAAMSLLAAGAVVLSGCEVPHTSTAYASVVVNCGGKPAISASGSTAQANAMKRFVSAYGKSCPGHTLNYTANGSGSGISDFLAGKSDFAGSDTPLGDDQTDAATKRCGGAPAWNLPVVFGPLAITYNLPVDFLVLDAQTHRRNLQRQHHPLGRPGHQRAERLHAVREHPRRLPQRQIRQHRQLPGLPGRPRPLGRGPRAPARNSRAASAPPPKVTTAPRRW